MADEWKQEWKDMPEFVQEKKKPFAQIVFRFETQEDLDQFAFIIGQKLTSKTKSAWHPYKPHCGGPNSGKRYVDES
jgi:hypothetical protein